MTPTGPVLRSSRAAGWRVCWMSRSFRLPRTSSPWLSLRATRSRGCGSGLPVGASRLIGRGCIRGWRVAALVESGGWCGQVESRRGRHRGEQARDDDLLPSRWNHVGWFVSGLLATPPHREPTAGQTGEGHGVGGGFGDGGYETKTAAGRICCRSDCETIAGRE